MREGLIIRDLQAADIELMAEAFARLGWNKPAAQYRRYLSEQEEGQRAVLVAFLDGRFAGYVTVIWQSAYPPFARHGVPEIVDLNVLPRDRRRGIGSALMDAAESQVAPRSRVAGLGVGLDPDYGAAQRMYVRRGYVPDGQGLMYAGRRVRHGESVTVDDRLVLYLTKELEVSHDTA
jgi:ribosomal protein S18 acetylase RimI-like enzyme